MTRNDISMMRSVVEKNEITLNEIALETSKLRILGHLQ